MYFIVSGINAVKMPDGLNKREDYNFVQVFFASRRSWASCDAEIREFICSILPEYIEIFMENASGPRKQKLAQQLYECLEN